MWFALLSNLFGDGKCDSVKVDNYAKLFLSSALEYGKATTPQKINSSSKSKKKSKDMECFFFDTSNYYSLLNLKDLIDHHGDMRKIWEGEREKYIKYVKRVLLSMQNNDTYLTNTLQNLLKSQCLDQFMDDNMYCEKSVYARTSNFKVYSSWDALKTEWDKGTVLFGVVLKGNVDGIYICISGKNGGISLLKPSFNDESGQNRFNLYYCPLNLESPIDELRNVFPNRKALIEVISDCLFIHPMVKGTSQYDKWNGHTVVFRSWRVRTKKGVQKFEIEKDIFFDNP